MTGRRLLTSSALYSQGKLAVSCAGLARLMTSWPWPDVPYSSWGREAPARTGEPTPLVSRVRKVEPEAVLKLDSTVSAVLASTPETTGDDDTSAVWMPPATPEPRGEAERAVDVVEVAGRGGVALLLAAAGGEASEAGGGHQLRRVVEEAGDRGSARLAGGNEAEALGNEGALAGGEDGAAQLEEQLHLRLGRRADVAEDGLIAVEVDVGEHQEYRSAVGWSCPGRGDPRPGRPSSAYTREVASVRRPALLCCSHCSACQHCCHLPSTLSSRAPQVTGGLVGQQTDRVGGVSLSALRS